MKTLLPLIFALMLAVNCFGAGATVATTNGVSYNQTLNSPIYKGTLGSYTNLPPGTLTNSAGLITSNTALPSIVLYPLGANFDTTNIQAALYANGGTGTRVILSPGIYFITNNLWITNNDWLSGYGATNNFTSTMPDFCFNWKTNVTGVILDGIRVDGGFTGSSWGANPAGVTNILSYLPATTGFGFTSHSGFYINMGGGGIVRNCEASGFSGFGFFLINTNGGTSYKAKMTKLDGINIAHDNYLGLWICGGFYDDGFGTLAAFSQLFGAEYTTISGWQFYNNSQGLGFGSGNAKVVNCTFGNNFVAAAAVPASNSGHGIFENNTVNHNRYSLILTGLGTGELIQGNTFLANDLGILLDNPTGVEIKHNKFDNSPVMLRATLTATSPNLFIGNSYQGVFATNGASGFSLNGNWDGVTNRYYLNYSSDMPNNTDGRLVGFGIQAYSTNVTLVAATSLQVFFAPGYAVGDSNYVVTTPNDLVGVTVSTKSTNSFTLSFTSATLTSQLIEGAVIHR